MPVYQISVPNLVADQASIASIISGLVVPTSFDTFINANFKLKPTADCDTLILHDFTDYQELGVIDLNDVVVTISYGYRHCCEDVIICDGISFTPNGQYVIENLDEDKEYFATIQIQYTDNTIPSDPQIYTKTFDVCYVKDCCSDSFRELSCTIVSKMNKIADTICCHKKIGRKITKLKDSYLMLSNLYWLYCNSKHPCNDRDQVYCLFNKIK